jgi:hypothetical protein
MAKPTAISPGAPVAAANINAAYNMYDELESARSTISHTTAGDLQLEFSDRHNSFFVVTATANITSVTLADAPTAGRFYLQIENTSGSSISVDMSGLSAVLAGSLTLPTTIAASGIEYLDFVIA